MQLQPGFKPIFTQYLSGFNSDASLFTHKSGAQVLFLKNDDPNKVCTISFKTQPHNNNGAPHLIEHMLINGSKKFQTDGFNELSKFTRHIYLNALTYPDKTIYAFASYAKSDFFVMLDVYLDGIFNPDFKKYEQFENFENVKNVVYNEMVALFEDDTYALNFFAHVMSETFDGRGTPEGVRNLDFEEVKRFYDEHYLKSCCHIYFYGDVNINLCLKQISPILEVEAKEKIFEPHEISPFNSKTPFIEKSFFCVAFKPDLTVQDIFTIKVLICALFELDESPIKDKLSLEKNLSYSVDFTMQNPSLSVIFDKQDWHNPTFFEEFFKEAALRPLVLDLAIEQVSAQEVEKSRLNSVGFKPRGFYLNLAFINNWIYEKKILLETLLSLNKNLVDKNLEISDGSCKLEIDYALFTDTFSRYFLSKNFFFTPFSNNTVDNKLEHNYNTNRCKFQNIKIEYNYVNCTLHNGDFNFFNQILCTAHFLNIRNKLYVFDKILHIENLFVNIMLFLKKILRFIVTLCYYFIVVVKYHFPVNWNTVNSAFSTEKIAYVFFSAFFESSSLLKINAQKLIRQKIINNCEFSKFHFETNFEIGSGAIFALNARSDARIFPLVCFILENDYFYNVLTAQNGVYNTVCFFDEDSLLYFSTTHGSLDRQAVLDVFSGAFNYLARINFSEGTFFRFKIACLNKVFSKIYMGKISPETENVGTVKFLFDLLVFSKSILAIGQDELKSFGQLCLNGFIQND